jgi:hypothetical protein
MVAPRSFRSQLRSVNGYGKIVQMNATAHPPATQANRYGASSYTLMNALEHKSD